jgi:hypothetical protein
MAKSVFITVLTIALAVMATVTSTMLSAPHVSACAISGSRIANCGGVTSGHAGTITCTAHTRTVTSSDGRTITQPNSC